jgi:hypothetical protein
MSAKELRFSSEARDKMLRGAGIGGAVRQAAANPLPRSHTGGKTSKPLRRAS